MDARTLVALVNGLSDADHAALRLALRARKTAEQAAAAEAFVGKGYPCTAVAGGCGRMLKTAKNAASHDSKTEHWHTPLAK